MKKIITVAIPIILIAATTAMVLFYSRFVEVKVDISNLADKELSMKREIQVANSTMETLSKALLAEKEKVSSVIQQKKQAIDSLEAVMRWQKIKITGQYEKKIDSLNKLFTVKPNNFLPNRYRKNFSDSTAMDRLRD